MLSTDKNAHENLERLSGQYFILASLNASQRNTSHDVMKDEAHKILHLCNIFLPMNRATEWDCYKSKCVPTKCIGLSPNPKYEI